MALAKFKRTSQQESQKSVLLDSLYGTNRELTTPDRMAPPCNWDCIEFRLVSFVSTFAVQKN
jgi:hypothetical protein